MSKIKSGLATLISSNVESKSMELLTSFLCPQAPARGWLWTDISQMCCGSGSKGLKVYGRDSMSARAPWGEDLHFFCTCFIFPAHLLLGTASSSFLWTLLDPLLPAMRFLPLWAQVLPTVDGSPPEPSRQQHLASRLASLLLGTIPESGRLHWPSMMFFHMLREKAGSSLVMQTVGWRISTAIGGRFRPWETSLQWKTVMSCIMSKLVFW